MDIIIINHKRCNITTQIKTQLWRKETHIFDKKINLSSIVNSQSLCSNNRRYEFEGERLQRSLHRQSRGYGLQLRAVERCVRDDQRSNRQGSRRVHARVLRKVAKFQNGPGLHHLRIVRRKDGGGICLTVVQGDVCHFIFHAHICPQITSHLFEFLCVSTLVINCTLFARHNKRKRSRVIWKASVWETRGFRPSTRSWRGRRFCCTRYIKFDEKTNKIYDSEIFQVNSSNISNTSSILSILRTIYQIRRTN